MITTNTKSTDLSDAAAPEDVVQILRRAADEMNQSQCDLDAAWQRTNGDVWAWLAKRIESFADQIEKEIPKHL